MKFFTSEWWSGCQTGEAGDAVRQYQAHIASIRDRLPKELLTLQENVILHDANLLSLNVAYDTQTAVLTLRLADGKNAELHYLGLVSFESFQTPDQALGGPGGYGDLGYDEVDVFADGLFEHSILFSSSIELRFRFRSLKLWPVEIE